MKEEEKNKLKDFLEDFQDLLKINHILLSQHSISRSAIVKCPDNFFIKQLFQIKTIQNLVENAEAFAKVLEFKERDKGELYLNTVTLINKFKPLYHEN